MQCHSTETRLGGLAANTTGRSSTFHIVQQPRTPHLCCGRATSTGGFRAAAALTQVPAAPAAPAPPLTPPVRINDLQAALSSGSTTAVRAGTPRSRPGLRPAIVLTGTHQAAAAEAVAKPAVQTNELQALETPIQQKHTCRVAYQGVPGAYTEMAAYNSCPAAELVPCEQLEDAFTALAQGRTDWAMLPIENSLGGSIHAVYDLLLCYRLHIVGETSVDISHCLLALPGTKLSDVTKVLSHPQALAQTDSYLRQLNVAREATDNTARAAQMVAIQQFKGVAAVASRQAAKLYGLDILATNIQDNKDNITRFIKLAREPLLSDEHAAAPLKTSIVFSLKEGPGQLFKALSVFSLRDIDMAKIESRPMRTDPILPARSSNLTPNGPGAGRQRFNYLFYVDFVGALSDPVCQNALRHLQENAPFLRVLGSYPME